MSTATKNVKALPVMVVINVRTKKVTFWHEFIERTLKGKGVSVTVSARTRDGLRDVATSCHANGINVRIVGMKADENGITRMLWLGARA